MIFEWYLKHFDGTVCMPYQEPFEYHAWYHATATKTDLEMVNMRLHPAQLAYFEIGQELNFAVDLMTGFEYWVKRVE